MKKIIDSLVEGFETIARGEDMQELLNSAGTLLDLTNDFTVVEQKIIYADKNIKKHVGNFASLALMLLVDKEVKYTEEIGKLLNIATFNFEKEFNEDQLEIANGLAYKYDSYFKGDIDFYPNDTEIQKLLELEVREVKKLKDCWGSESYFGFINGKQYTEGYDTVKELVEQNDNFKFIQFWRY